MPTLNSGQRACLLNLLIELVNQEEAQILIPANQPAAGFWFGGGKLVQDAAGAIWLSGRYRNYGDSRTGLEAGTRGMECAIFRSEDGGQTFTKVQSWTKADLSYPEQQVISIEGTALHQLSDGTWECFISSEKTIDYPAPWQAYQKPGTGIWTIDRITGGAPDSLDSSTLEPTFNALDHPAYLHVKDPYIFEAADGAAMLIFSHHPFTWASSNTGLAVRPPKARQFSAQRWELAQRGVVWDVAATRITTRLQIPQIGCFAEFPPCSVYFYDGAECMRPHDDNPRGHIRPRGYSCEELGSVFFGWDAAFPAMERLSPLEPLYLSPWGTGTSRYVDTLTTQDGILAVWQQSQQDFSQPLVGYRLAMEEIRRILEDKRATGVKC